jgi:aminoglycoside phosphotransferase (APT) family kinase protein
VTSTARISDLAAVHGRLNALARKQLGGDVADLSLVPKGISSVTYSATLKTASGDRPMIIKIAPPGLMPKANRDVLRQARILRALRAGSSLPVPEVLLYDDGAPPETPPLFAMAVLPGDAIDPTWPDDPTLDAELVRDRGLAMARMLAELHRVDVRSVVPAEPPLSLVDEIERWTAAYATVDDRLDAPAKHCRSLLLKRAPAPMSDALNHGDYRYGNVLFEDAAVSGLIDWEIAAVEDPRFDLANLVLYCGKDSPLRLRDSTYAHTGEEIVNTYESVAGGAVVDLDWFMRALRYKCAAALALLVKHNRRSQDPNPLMETVAERLPDFLAAAAL